MVLATPNYFDEIKRIRTPSLPYDPGKDYSLIIEQLTESCRAFKYRGASPQNLIAPAELLPVVVIRQGRRIRHFVNPVITDVKGGRLQLDACGNIYLMHGEKEVPLVVMVRRPRQIKLSYVTTQGVMKEEEFADPVRRGVWPQSICNFIVHEIAHLHGELIVDNARMRLINLRESLERRVKECKEAAPELTFAAYKRMPFVLVRRGNLYVLRHGSELRSIPLASPDAVYFDAVDAPINEILQMHVPRGGERLPIRSSRFLKSIFS